MFCLHAPLKAVCCFVHFLSLMMNAMLLFWHRTSFCVRKLYIVVIGYKFRQHGQKLGKSTEWYFAVSWDRVIACAIWNMVNEIMWDQLTVLRSIYIWNQTWQYRYHYAESATAEGKWRQDNARTVQAMWKELYLKILYVTYRVTS